MNGHTENKKNTYAHLDRLSTEDLEELLCADINSPDDDDDEDDDNGKGISTKLEKAMTIGGLIVGAIMICSFPLVVSPMWTRRWRNFGHTTISLR